MLSTTDAGTPYKGADHWLMLFLVMSLCSYVANIYVDHQRYVTTRRPMYSLLAMKSGRSGVESGWVEIQYSTLRL